MKLKLAIIALALLLVLTAVIGLSLTAATAQTENTLYLPLTAKSCVGCDPRPTPTPRMWTHWGEERP
jgi:hypothetical protein